MSALTLQAFLEQYPPGRGMIMPGDDLISCYRELLPASLLELWKTAGFGPYGDGLIQVVNPDDYKAALYGWLMYEEEDPSRLPIALSAFGDIFYYRCLTEDDEDVAHIDPHFSGGDVLIWSLDGFFNDYLCDPEVQTSLLDRPLFEKAREMHGDLENGQIYSFVPALRLGGSRSADVIERVDAVVHLDLLLQLALAE